MTSRRPYPPRGEGVEPTSTPRAPAFPGAEIMGPDPRAVTRAPDAAPCCSFCGRSVYQVRRMIAGRCGAYICNLCVAIVAGMCADGDGDAAATPAGNRPHAIIPPIGSTSGTTARGRHHPYSDTLADAERGMPLSMPAEGMTMTVLPSQQEPCSS
jgi:hypothetical protein